MTEAPFLLLRLTRSVASYLRATSWSGVVARALHLTSEFQAARKREEKGRGRHLQELTFFKKPFRKSCITFLHISHCPELNHTATSHNKESGKCLDSNEVCQAIRIQLLREEKRKGN